MRTLTFESECACSAEKLYAFHADPTNLPLITPPGITVRIVKMPETIETGSTAVLYIRRGLLGFRWHLRFEAVEVSRLIVDVAERAPFRYFRHEHRFISLDANRALLRDTVRFSLPMGWLGRLIEPLVARDLRIMFAYRHAETKKRLEP